MPDTAAVAAFLVGGAVILPSLGKVFTAGRFRPKEAFARTGVKLSTPEEREQLARKLAQAGVKESPEWFLGLRFTLIAVFLLLFLPMLLFGADLFWLILFAPLLYFAPGYWLNGKIAKRKSEIRLALADFTLYFSTVLSAGADVQMALKEAAEGAGGVLQEEIERALIEARTAESFPVALDKMADRCDVDELRALARALNQALRYGGRDLAGAMKAHSAQMGIIRKYETMEAANKLSVKMIMPVLMFILVPCMIVLGYPALMALMEAFK